MKKILFLLGIYTAMGFTTASESKKAEATAETSRPKKTVRTYGYIETSSPEAYTLTLH